MEKIENAVRDPVNGTAELDEILSDGRESKAEENERDDVEAETSTCDQGSRKRKR